MKNIKFKNIFFNKINKFNNYLINKFNQISALKNKFNKIIHLKNKFNKISNFNKFLILFISILFLYLFYVSIPSLYDYQKLQNQLKAYLVNDYNLNIKISDKIQYKILPSPHFEVKESNIYRNTESEENKLGEIKNLRIFVSLKNIYNQDKIELKDIEIKDAVFFLDKNNRIFLSNYFNNKNTNKKIQIKKSKFFLMKNDEIISIFPIKNLNFIYDEIIFTNEAIIDGKAFNSYFNLKIKKYFLGDEDLNFDIKFPQINLSVNSKLLPQKKNKEKYKVLNKVNFFGSEIKFEFDVDKNSLIYKSTKSKIFNTQIDFNGLIEFQPFYLISNIILDQFNLVKALNSEDSIFKLIDNRNLIHKNFNSKIFIDIRKFSKDNIFNRGEFFIEIQNGIIKFDDSIFISDKIGFLKVLSSSLYTNNNKLLLKTHVLVDIQNLKKFYNTFQVPKKFRLDIKKINFNFETNLTSGKSRILNFQIDNIISDNLTKKINKIIEENNLNINENFNNWIVLKRFLNIIISEINQG